MEVLPALVLNRSLAATYRSTVPTITNRKTKKANPKPQRRPPPPFRRTLPDSLPYSKPTPTPLLTTSPTTAAATPKTRDQHLDAILRDIEASVSRGVSIDPSTFSSLLEACYQTGSFHRADRLHGLIPTSLLRRGTGLAAKLLRLYAARGDVDVAHQLFDEMPDACRTRDAFAWNALIAGYADRGDHEDAMALYYQMEEDGVPPDGFTFPRVLKACAGIGSLAVGESVHRDAVKSGFGDDPYVMNALVDMYAKCGDVGKARRVFDVILPQSRDVVSWNAMVVGYARHGLYLEALGLCRDMVRSGSDPPDSVAISSMLSAVPHKTSRFGPEIHGWALRRGLASNLSVANALITMYAEQGRVRLARTIFDAVSDKDVVSWNTIIAAHRREPRALLLFRQMQEEDSSVQPDEVTFVLLLSACARLGLVNVGRELFAMMAEYGIEPRMEHYSCMVNLLGRAGMVDEAYELVSKMMPFDGGPTVWGALLYGCSLHGNVAVGEVAAERLFDLEPDNGHNFKLLMEIYSKVGRLEDMERVRKMMTDRGLDS